MHGHGRILVGLAIAAMLAIAAAACGSSSNKSSSTTTGAQRSSGTASSNTAAAPASGSSGSSGATVSVVHNAKYGNILAGPNGHTLYLFEADKGTKTACGQGACKAVWPALAASSGKPTAGSGVDASKLMTAMGQVPNQIVYNGHLLYYFSGDMGAGQANGTSIPMWYVVSPSGEEVETH